MQINKKSNILDIVDSSVIVITLVIVFFIVFTVMSEFNTRFDTNEITNSSEPAMSFYDTFTSRFTNAWDYGALFLVILMPLFSFIMAKKIETSPSIMIITFFVLGFIILISMIITNIYGGFEDNAKFQTFTASLVFIPIIMKNLLYYSIIYSIIVLIALFGKPSAE